MSRSELERRILATLQRARTREDVLGAIPLRFSDELVVSVLNELIARGAVSLVKTEQRRNDDEVR